MAFPQKGESLAHHSSTFGGLAQLGERLPCKQEVTGSIPVLSTKRNWLKYLETDTSLSFFNSQISHSKQIKSPEKWVLIWEEKQRNDMKFSAKAKAEDGNGMSEICFDDVPWKLNIVIMMQLWEGNSKG